MTGSLPQPSQPQLRLLRHLARTGGTLISKCLGCMDSVILLSESHPLAMDKWTNLFEQANRWHGLTTSQEINGWKKRGAGAYAEVLGVLNARAEARGKALVVREWTHLDFVGIPFITPPMHAEATQTVENEFDLRIVDTVRHPLDHWLSMNRIETLRGITLETHLAGCAAFSKEIARVASSNLPHRILKYEDFCTNPREHLLEICQTLEIPMDKDWESKWASFEQITGDTAGSRGTQQRAIESLSRHTPPPGTVEACVSNPAYLEACSAWGYQAD